MTVLDRFWEKVDRSGGPDACWPWTGGRSDTGYGAFQAHGRKVGAHRFSLELTLGRPIGAGLMARHRCDNPPCVNPAHLIEGDQSANLRDASGRDRHPAARLTNDQAEALRRRRSEGISFAKLAREFGVSKSLVQMICAGRVRAAR